MRRFWKPCEACREDVSLLVSGVLPETERARIERHLALCDSCRDYYAEIKRVAAPLANWEKDFARIEPDQILKNRWAKAIKSVDAPKHGKLVANFSVAWWQLFGSARRTWLGFGIVWLVLLVINVADPDRRSTRQMANATPSREFIMALKEQQQMYLELIGAPPEPADKPRDPTKPRTERQPGWKIG